MNDEKKYNEALERARKLYEQGTITESLCYVFPELKESKDEGIRKEIIEQINLLKSTTLSDLKVNQFNSWIDWLEKQGEQKPVDKVEPKFHKDKWITNGDYTWKIVEVKPLDYILQSQDGNIVDDTISHVDEQFHSFTIKDAKPGDIIYLPNGNNEYYFFIFKGIENAAVKSFAHFYQYNDGTFEVEGTIDNLSSVNDVFQPATKEQRDALIKAMANAGYTFDFEKKELKKIEQKTAWSEEDKETLQTIINDLSEELNEETDKEEQEILSAKISFLQSLKPRPIHKWSREDNRTRLEITDFLECHKMEEPTRVDILNKWIAWIANLEPQWKQKSAWSEEDEKIYQSIMDDTVQENQLNSKQTNWLRDIKYRYFSQPKQEWSEADEYNQAWLIEHLYGIEDSDKEYEMKCRKMAEWLKSLKDKVQPKQEWSMYDKTILKTLIDHFEYKKEFNEAENYDIVLWLKSLRPQNTWKPSDEQMKLLKELVEDNNQRYFYTLLRSLYDQLKILKGE